MTDARRRRGNPRSYPERLLLRLPRGTKAALSAVLGRGESTGQAARAAVLREIARRQRRLRAVSEPD